MTLDRFACIGLLTLVGIGQASAASAPPSGDNVFRAYVQTAVGGTWTTALEDHKFEHSYRSAGGKKFVQLNAKGGTQPFVATIGVDPETGRCTWWGFNEDGSIGTSVMTQEADGVWILEGKGKGIKGENRYKGRLSRVDENTVKEEVLELMVNGEKQATPTLVWKRKG